jgi:hypothetical protein
MTYSAPLVPVDLKRQRFSRLDSYPNPGTRRTQNSLHRIRRDFRRIASVNL